MGFDEKQVIRRIQQLRIEHFGLRGKSSFAKKLGLSASTYNYYEQDRLAPLPVLVKISELTGADLSWLIKGEKNDDARGVSPRDLRILERIWRLDAQNPHSIAAVVALLDLLEESSQLSERKKASQKSSFQKMIPVLGRTAAGVVGLWSDTVLQKPEDMAVQLADIVEKHTLSKIKSCGLCGASVEKAGKNTANLFENAEAELIQVDDSENCQVTEFVNCTEIKSAYPDAFGLWVDGDSMAPRINDGQIVIVSPSVLAVNGQIAVIKLKGQIGVTCKIYRLSQDKVHLIPINERYETKITDSEQILWALSVVCKINTKN